MKNRITDKDLEGLVSHLNEITNSPKEPYSKDLGKFKSNVGNYHLSYAYGGVNLHRMANEAGGVTTPLIYGHVTKRELYNLLHAYISGIKEKKPTVSASKEYTPRCLSWCKSYEEEERELRELIECEPADVKQLKEEYKQLTGKSYRRKS